MFTSGTQALQGRTVNHDPKPYFYPQTGYRASAFESARLDAHNGYDPSRMPLLHPRAEFAVLDNPVLTLFRAQRTPVVPLNAHVRGFLNGITRLASEGFTPEQIDHARRVLILLAKLEVSE